MHHPSQKEFVRDLTEKESLEAEIPNGSALRRFVNLAKEEGAFHTVKKVDLKISEDGGYQFADQLLKAIDKKSKIEEFKLIGFAVDTSLLHEVAIRSPNLSRLTLEDCKVDDYSHIAFIIGACKNLTHITIDTVGHIKEDAMKAIMRAIRAHEKIQHVVIRNPNTLLKKDTFESLKELQRNVDINFRKNRDKWLEDIDEELDEIREREKDERWFRDHF